MPPLPLTSSAASLMAFAAETPKAAVEPVSDRNAPIFIVFECGSGMEQAERRRHRARRSWKILLIGLVFYRIYKIVQDLHVNLVSSCNSCKRLVCEGECGRPASPPVSLGLFYEAVLACTGFSGVFTPVNVRTHI